jgi:hypothetical protein
MHNIDDINEPYDMDNIHEIYCMEENTLIKMIFLNWNSNSDEANNINDEKYCMDEMNQMMKFTTTSWIKLTITCNTNMTPTRLGYQFQCSNMKMFDVKCGETRITKSFC